MDTVVAVVVVVVASANRFGAGGQWWRSGSSEQRQQKQLPVSSSNAVQCTTTLSRPTNQTADVINVINSMTRSPGGPRASGPAPPSVNYEGRPVHLSLDLLAFPLPHTFRFYFRCPANNVSEAVTRDQLHIDCWNTFAVYAITCNITVDKIGAAEAGYYSVQIQNDFGLETVVFEIKYHGKIFCICDSHFKRYTCSEPFSLSFFFFLLILKTK